MLSAGDHGSGRDSGGRDHRSGAVSAGPAEVRVGDPGKHVEDQVGIRPALPDAAGIVGQVEPEVQMAYDRSALLGQAGLVESVGAETIEQRRRGQELVDGHHPGAANADRQDRRRARTVRLGRLGEGEHRAAVIGQGWAIAEFDGDEGRAFTSDTGEVEIAGLLMDPGLAAERCLHRMHAHAVGDLAAVAAAVTDRLIDHNPRGRGRCGTPLPGSAQLRRAALVVDQHRRPGNVAQVALDLVETVAMHDVGAGREAGIHRVLVGLVGDDHDTSGAFGFDQPGQFGDAGVAGCVLTARHRDGAVVENFERDVGASRDRLTDRQETRMGEGAVADVLKAMFFGHERGSPSPLGPFAAHLGDASRSILQDRHRVAPDAATGHGPVWQLGRAVMGAARTEIR